MRILVVLIFVRRFSVVGGEAQKRGSGFELGGNGGTVRLEKFALSARLEAAREEAAKNPWWAWSVWLLGHAAHCCALLHIAIGQASSPVSPAFSPFSLPLTLSPYPRPFLSVSSTLLHKSSAVRRSATGRKAKPAQ